MKKLIIFLIVVTSFFAYSQTEKKPARRSVEEVTRSLYGKLEKTALANNVVKPKLSLGLELLRTDKQNQEIFLKKSEYPLGFLKTTLFKPSNFKLSIYEGIISIPVQIYNPDKKELSLKSKKVQEAESEYRLEIIPVDKHDNTYTLMVTIGSSFRNISYVMAGDKRSDTKQFGEAYGHKKIELKVGEKIKITAGDYRAYQWGIEDVIDGKKIIFESNKDYYNYFNDYLILSLESDK